MRFFKVVKRDEQTATVRIECFVVRIAYHNWNIA